MRLKIVFLYFSCDTRQSNVDSETTNFRSRVFAFNKNVVSAKLMLSFVEIETRLCTLI